MRLYTSNPAAAHRRYEHRENRPGVARRFPPPRLTLRFNKRGSSRPLEARHERLVGLERLIFIKKNQLPVSNRSAKELNQGFLDLNYRLGGGGGVSNDANQPAASPYMTAGKARRKFLRAAEEATMLLASPACTVMSEHDRRVFLLSLYPKGYRVAKPPPAVQHGEGLLMRRWRRARQLAGLPSD